MFGNRKNDCRMHRKTLRTMCALFAFLLLTLFLTACGAGGKQASFSGADVPFEPTVYYARDGRIRFLYDSTSDMISTIENYDIVSLYDAGDYSLVISYREGTVPRRTADENVRAEFSQSTEMEISAKTKACSVSGYPFRRTELTAADGSHGAVLYGSTKTGFAEIYYILSSDAPDAVQSHLEDILSTVSLAEFTESGDDGYTRVYYGG